MKVGPKVIGCSPLFLRFTERSLNTVGVKWAIYEEDGITFARDVDTFNYRLERLREKINMLDKKRSCCLTLRIDFYHY
jgi:hypothetical protein